MDLSASAGSIVVCPLSALDRTLKDCAARRVITLTGPGRPRPDLDKAGLDARLELVFNDIAKPQAGLVAPSTTDISRIVGFAREWDRRHPLLIHCWMGISRSTAAALIVACAIQKHRSPHSLARELRTSSPSATPNPLMIAHGDELLGLGGMLIDAVGSIGRGADAMEGNVFALDPDLAMNPRELG